MFEKAQKILEYELQSLHDDLIKEHRRLKMTATGKWERSLAIEVKLEAGRLIGRVVGEHYTRQLQFGRKPGKMPPVDMIHKWIKAKGIRALKDGMTTRRLAWAIAVKIKKKGTKYFRQGGTTLISNVVTPERIRQIIDDIQNSISEELFATTIDKLKELEKAA